MFWSFLKKKLRMKILKRLRFARIFEAFDFALLFITVAVGRPRGVRGAVAAPHGPEGREAVQELLHRRARASPTRWGWMMGRGGGLLNPG